MPDHQQAVAASEQLDAKLTGANPIDVLIEFPKGASLYDAKTLAAIADVHAILEKQSGVGNVWSLETLRRWLAEKALKIRRRHAQAVCRPAPEISDPPLHLRQAGCGDRQRPRAGCRREPVAADRRRARQTVERRPRKIPGYTIAVTGLSVIAARNSAIMIDKLRTA